MLSLYLTLGLGGAGAGIALHRLVNWMGARRGLTEDIPASGHARQHFSALALATALSAVLIGIVVSANSWAEILRRGGLAVCLAGCADADGRWGIVPNEFVVGGLAVGSGLALASEHPLEFFWTGLGMAGLLFVLRYGSVQLLGHPGFGMGDLKLSAVLGIFLGANALWVFYLAVLAAGFVGAAGLAMGTLRRTSRIPLAPFMALGTAAHWFLIPFSTVAGWLYL